MRHLSIFLVSMYLLLKCSPVQDHLQTASSENKIDWIHHVDSLIMPFWMSEEALGNPPGNFPAYRYPDGSAVDPSNPDYARLVPEYQQFYMGSADSLRRDFIRVKSRQIYGYCIAFHLTGNERYLENAKRGLDYLIENDVYADSSVVSFWGREGLPQPGKYQRNAQDLAYGLLAPSIYYYLTRDPDILKILLTTNRFVWDAYYEQADLKASTKLFAWVRENFESDSTQQKELIAPLDQLNAYTLLLAQFVPDSLSSELTARVRILAHSIKDNFYSEKYNLFWSSLNTKRIGGNTDFAHSIKSFWMLYVSARLIGDTDLETFASTGAQRLLNTAYQKGEGRWVSNYRDESMELDKSIFAWHCAELDQMAATLSFRDTSIYTTYLKQTYSYFEEKMIDHTNKGTYWGRSAEGDIIEVGFRSGWHMANFHDMEHALIGYLSTAHYFGDDIKLYFAFGKRIDPETSVIKPYYYAAEIRELKQMEFDTPVFSDLVKTQVIFDNIH